MSSASYNHHMAEAKPPVAAELVWSGDLRFAATSGESAIVTDGKSAAGPSPVQLLAIALAGCMAADVVDILLKGRHPLTAFRTTITGTRAQEPPKRLLTAHLRFHVHGAVPPAAVERAITMSRDKYCSVSQSLRPDIEITTEFEILP